MCEPQEQQQAQAKRVPTAPHLQQHHQQIQLTCPVTSLHISQMDEKGPPPPPPIIGPSPASYQQRQTNLVGLPRPQAHQSSSEVTSQGIMSSVFGVPHRTSSGCWCNDVPCANCYCERRTQKSRELEGARSHAVVLRGCDVKHLVSCRTINYQYILSLRKTKLPLNTWLRLGSLLLVLLLAIASVQSAPTMTLENSRLNSAPKWMNPCGFTVEEFEGDLEVVQLNDATLLGNIVMQAKTAFNYAHSFRDDYIKRTFNTDFADLHLAWKTSRYDWLPGPKQIPKQLGEQLDQEFLDKVEVRMLDTALLDAYEYMQRYAVGLEQIAWDQEDYNLEFRKQFKDTEYHLRSVLCELQMALAERQVAPRADVSRDLMSSEYRGMTDSTFRNLRDWMIYRDYMNGLEYIIQVFEHLVRAMKS